MIIYSGAKCADRIDYVKLREQIENNNFMFLLPKDLKESFETLYDIHLCGTEYYKANKYKIHECLKEIVEKLNEYGVKTLGYK